MNLAQPLDDLEWQELIEDTAQYFNEIMLKRGFQYYKQQRVRDLEITDSGDISAGVSGTEPYYVRLYPADLQRSICSCPVETRCKHLAAALLEAASRQGRSITALVNAHSAPLLSRRSKVTSAARGTGTPQDELDHGKPQLQKLLQTAPRLGELSIAEWHEFFRQASLLPGVAVTHSMYSRSAMDAIQQLKPAGAKLSMASFTTLYDFNASLFILGQLIGQSKNSNGATLFMGYHVQMAAEQLLNSMTNQLDSGKWSFRIQEMKERETLLLQGTIDFLRDKMLSGAPKSPTYYQVYSLLWARGIAPYSFNAAFYERELQQLETAANEKQPPASSSISLMASALMHFYLKQDEACWDKLYGADEVMHIHPYDLFQFLDAVEQNKDGHRLVRWLVETGPLFAHYNNPYMSQYMSFWEQALEWVPQAEAQMWDTLTAMLPFSKVIYDDALWSRGQWRRWIDLQLSTEREPLDYRVSVLAPIEKEEPELLLPFYHQAVERYVLQKNRSSYKSAVKLLKRLAKLYKKLKQPERWELFLDAFIERHSRLRALHEEMRRGKLLS
ncbi:SWIM zinc finger domain-containing protein [Paenibacillus sp. JSM ZJ436]|uniref:SWIM zinc finger domain-containing protein n=1 Tax=Paenibacillus sp. JSM ZJ436 TaxID=3376190 RepID=UPI0037B431D7